MQTKTGVGTYKMEFGEEKKMMGYQKSNLLRDIETMHLDPGGTLLIHSSMKSIGKVEGGADTVLDAWCEYMKDGLLVFPTHTWAQIGRGSPVFDSRTEPSCVGILPELFRHRPGAVRSLHPTHSVAAIGKDAAVFTAGEEKMTTPCGREGCWGRLLDRDATILFLGCTLRSNTFIHGVEEWNGIPLRLTEDTEELISINSQGRRYSISMHRHYCPYCSDISQNSGKLEEPFRRLDAIQYRKFGDALCIVGNARRMAAITSALLQREPQLFLDNSPIPANWY